MNPETQPQTSGGELGRKALADMLSKARTFCAHECERIRLTSDARIAALRAEIALLRDEEADQQQRLHRALPAGDLCQRRRKAFYYWTVTAFLTVAGFFFSLLAFDPFRLGWKRYLYCAGIAVTAPFCVEKFLDVWSSSRLFKILASIACVAALSSLVLLALVRGDVLAEAARNVASVITFQDNPAPVSETNTFYDRTLPILRLLMALLAFAMEIGAGLALYEARRLGATSGEDAAKVTQELKGTRERMVEKLQELRQLENAAAIFENEFWRDFFHALSEGLPQHALTKVAALILGLVLLAAPQARAADRLNLVLALDFTQSVAVKGSDQKPEFQKNIDAASRLLAELPVGSRVTVLGITGTSFTQPEIVLAAELSTDPGYFGERLQAARTQLAAAFRARVKNVEPVSPRTDIIGALLAAADLFRTSPAGKNVLVLFSDMRNDTRELELERPRKIPTALALSKVERTGLMPNLHGVEVYVVGVDGAGKDIAYWQSLRNFWTAYFTRTGANLKRYSILREPIPLP